MDETMLSPTWYLMLLAKDNNLTLHRYHDCEVLFEMMKCSPWKFLSFQDNTVNPVPCQSSSSI